MVVDLEGYVKSWIENSPMSVAIGLVALGFLVLFLGWNGAAGKDFVEGQVPYVVSGGLLGIALVASGLTVVVVQANRRDTQELIGRIDRLEEVLRPAVSGEDGVADANTNGRRRRSDAGDEAPASPPKAKAKSKAKAKAKTSR